MDNKTQLSLICAGTLAVLIGVWWIYFRVECKPNVTLTTEHGTYACVDGKMAKQ